MTAIQLVDAIDSIESAESIETPALNADMTQIFEHLAQEGFRPTIKNDNVLAFKCEGWTVNLDAYANDRGYQLYLCAGGEIDLQDTTFAIAAVNLLNARLRYVKVFLSESRWVWVTIESIEMNVESYLPMVVRGAEVLVNAAREFGEEFRKQRQPMTLNS